MASSGLIITADDYGLNPNVNQGIRDAVAKGIVSSVHVMPNLVNQQDINLLIQAIRAGGNNCGIGLHLNTTWGPAIIQQDAAFKHPYGHGIEAGRIYYYYRGLNTYQHATVILNAQQKALMRAELVAQFNHLATLLGGSNKIDAISSHYNFHLWDYTYITMVSELSKAANIPVRSPLRWTTEQIPQPFKYPLGTGPLTRAGLARLKKIISSRSTLALMSTALNKKKLHKCYNNLRVQNVNYLPANSSGHWFGQPSLEAMRWFIQQLHDINILSGSRGYASEVYMHISNSILGGSELYGYKQHQRKAEHNVLMHPQFLINFQNWKQQYGTRHGSYRKVLQNVNIQY